MCCGYSKEPSLLSTHNHICNIEGRYVYDVLGYHLVKLAQEVWLGELTIAVDWDVKYQAKQIFVICNKEISFYLNSNLS